MSQLWIDTLLINMTEFKTSIHHLLDEKEIQRLYITNAPLNKPMPVSNYCLVLSHDTVQLIQQKGTQRIHFNLDLDTFCLTRNNIAQHASMMNSFKKRIHFILKELSAKRAHALQAR